MPHEAHQTIHPPQVEPLVHTGALRARRGGSLVRDNRYRPLFRLRGASSQLRWRPGCGGLHPLDRRGLDGGLAALVLTITMVVVQLAMGQFSPRIVQRILRDKHGRHLDETGQVRLIVRTMSWEAYVHLAFDEIRLAGGGSPQVTRRLKAALTDLRSIAPPERVRIIDFQLDLLSTTTEASLSDERDVELALHEDREGIGAAATSIDGTALFVPCSERSSPR